MGIKRMIRIVEESDGSFLVSFYEYDEAGKQIVAETNPFSPEVGADLNTIFTSLCDSKAEVADEAKDTDGNEDEALD